MVWRVHQQIAAFANSGGFGGFMKIILIGLAAIGTIGASQPATASVFGDDLSKCLVQKTNDADRTLLIQWVFAAMSASPAVKSMSSTTAEQREEYSRKAGILFQRLLTGDCRKETVNALKYDGVATFAESFRLLGEVAMGGLMKDPAVNAVLDQLGAGIANKEFVDLAKEAGLDAPKQPAAK